MITRKFIAMQYHADVRPLIVGSRPVSTAAYERYRDFQGNICAVIRGDKLIQATNYYPYGMPIAGGTNPDEQRHKYSGKELLTHYGLNCYELRSVQVPTAPRTGLSADMRSWLTREILRIFGPRLYDPALLQFHNPDLLQEKYYGLHAYLYCAANPIRNIDPSGMTVVALQEDMQEAIKYTLRPEDAEFVEFKDGVLNHDKLIQCISDSKNFQSLMTLSASNLTYEFEFAESFTDGTGKRYDLTSIKGDGTSGVTMVPDAPADANPSYDENVHIVVSSKLTTIERITTLSHEVYGHGYLNEVRGYGIDVNPYHENKFIVKQYRYLEKNEQSALGIYN